MSKIETSFKRPEGRRPDALRPLSIVPTVLKFAEGSAQIDLGDTRVLTAATLEPRVPRFRQDSGEGWLTAEYSMLPRSTFHRVSREVKQGRPGGRTMEIQRLIGRSLRAAMEFPALGEQTITVDCDVLQADGGTRTASITAGYVAMVEAVGKAFLAGDIPRWPVHRQVAAVSVGFVEGVPLLDLEYCEDSIAEVDLNVVATSDGELIEVQGTGEQRSFSRRELNTLLDLAFLGLDRLFAAQNEALATVLEQVESVRRRGRPRAEPKDESSLWGPPSR